MQVLVMDQNLKQHESGKSKADINIVMREMDNADDLRTHLQMHGGEKPNKCNQCDYASSRADHLRTHLKTHKCNRCNFASSRADMLRRHVKLHNGEKSNKCNKCDFIYFLGQTS